MSVFSYARPKALGEALKLLKNGTVALAGGTDLMTLVRHGISRPDKLVDLTGIEGLRGWSREKGKGVRIGALTSLADLEPALIALDAEIEFASSLGKRRIKLNTFYIAPTGKQRKEHAIKQGELITNVRIPESALARRGVYLKA